MIKINAKHMFSKFYSDEMSVDDLKKLITDFVSESRQHGEIESFEINNNGMIDIKLTSGEEIEIEVDWNELILK